jgi:hypothetical protein
VRAPGQHRRPGKICAASRVRCRLAAEPRCTGGRRRPRRAQEPPGSVGVRGEPSSIAVRVCLDHDSEDARVDEPNCVDVEHKRRGGSLAGAAVRASPRTDSVEGSNSRRAITGTASRRLSVVIFKSGCCVERRLSWLSCSLAANNVRDRRPLHRSSAPAADSTSRRPLEQLASSPGIRAPKPNRTA